MTRCSFPVMIDGVSSDDEVTTAAPGIGRLTQCISSTERQHALSRRTVVRGGKGMPGQTIRVSVYNEDFTLVRLTQSGGNAVRASMFGNWCPCITRSYSRPARQYTALSGEAVDLAVFLGGTYSTHTL